jgi:hypothetical protein
VKAGGKQSSAEILVRIPTENKKAFDKIVMPTVNLKKQDKRVWAVFNWLGVGLGFSIGLLLTR